MLAILKVWLTLSHTHITPFFGLGRTRIDGIISPPYPEVTLDTFSFWVGGRSAARRAVLQPRLPKVAFFGSKMLFFGRKLIDSLHGGPLGGGRVHFWPKIDPKNCLFSCYTLKHPFLVLRRTTLYGIIASPYPEATLISFSFPIWYHFGPNMADNWFAD